MSRLRRSSLIPRYSYPMVRRNLVVSSPTPDNPFANSTEEIEFTRMDAKACTIQSMSGWEVSSLPESIRNKEVFTIFTNTALFGSLDDTTNLSDAIYIPASFYELNGVVAPNTNSGWFTVVKTKFRNSGVINHVEAVIVRDTYTETSEGLPQYPDTSLLDPLVDTRTKLLAGSWITAWENENV